MSKKYYCGLVPFDKTTFHYWMYVCMYFYLKIFIFEACFVIIFYFVFGPYHFFLNMHIVLYSFYWHNFSPIIYSQFVHSWYITISLSKIFFLTKLTTCYHLSSLFEFNFKFIINVNFIMLATEGSWVRSGPMFLTRPLIYVTPDRSFPNLSDCWNSFH